MATDYSNQRRRRSGVTLCKTCRASIVWALSQNDRRMPMDAVPVEDGDWIFVDGRARKIQPFEDVAEETNRYTCHFATCPDADSHRTARPRETSP